MDKARAGTVDGSALARSRALVLRSPAGALTRGASLDHLVGDREHARRDSEAERVGGL
jgi:hypothetical protein